MYFIGSVAGTILMFSNSAYSNVASGSDGYRSFQLSNFIGNSISSFFNTIYKELIFQNYALNIILSLCIIVFLCRYLKKNINSKYNKIINLLLLVLVAFPVYSLFIKLSGVQIFLKYTKYISGLFSIIYFLAVFVSALFITDKAMMRRVIFALLSILMLTAPLFVVTPIGSRCFFPMYILWVWVTVEFMVIALENYEEDFFKILLIAGILVCYSGLLLIYGYIFKVNMQRINYIEENRDKDCLVLPELPYTHYHWLGNPASDEFMMRFKLFYNIDQDVEIEFVSLSEWKKVK